MQLEILGHCLLCGCEFFVRSIYEKEYVCPECKATRKIIKGREGEAVDRDLIISSLRHCISSKGCKTCPQRENGKRCEMSLEIIVALVDDLLNECEARGEEEVKVKQ